jgi:hypothetical protein
MSTPYVGWAAARGVAGCGHCPSALGAHHGEHSERAAGRRQANQAAEQRRGRPVGSERSSAVA